MRTALAGGAHAVTATTAAKAAANFRVSLISMLHPPSCVAREQSHANRMENACIVRKEGNRGKEIQPDRQHDATSRHRHPGSRLATDRAQGPGSREDTAADDPQDRRQRQG